MVHIAVVRAGSSVSAATARKMRALLQLAFLEKFSGSYGLLLDTDAELVLNRAQTYLTRDCSTRACLARMLKILECESIIHGDVRRDGDKLRLAMRNVRAAPGGKTRVHAKVNFTFAENRMNHFIRETASALMRPGYRMVMNPGPAFEEAVEIKSPEVSGVTQLDTKIFRFKSVNPVIAARISGWKDQVEQADRACEEGRCQIAIGLYTGLMARIRSALPERERGQVRGFLVELEKRLAAAYVGYFAQRLKQTDGVVWGNRVADLRRALKRYADLEAEILAVKASYRRNVGPVRAAITERKKLVPLVVSRTFEKLGDGEYGAFRFDHALYFLRRGIAAASVVPGPRGDARVRHLQSRGDLIRAVRRQYTTNRINILFAALPRFRARNDKYRARQAVHRARSLLRMEGADSPEMVAALNRAALSVGLSARAAHTLTIRSDVSAARVIMNGRPIGRAPVTRILLQGSYLFRVESKGYRPRSVSYRHSGNKVLTIRLQR